MDAAAHRALQDLVRATVSADLDALHNELDSLRREVLAVRMVAGLPVVPPGRRERQERVLELRADGLSARAIAIAMGVCRETVLKDLKAAGAARPAVTTGVDGTVRRSPPA